MTLVTPQQNSNMQTPPKVANMLRLLLGAKLSLQSASLYW